jgi:hypothetical protein
MASGVFCSTNPKDVPVAVAFVLAAFGVLCCARLMSREQLPHGLSSLGLVLFFTAIAISLPIALLNDITFRDWLFRGLVPFSFLGVFFLLPIHTESDARFVIRALVFVSLLWSAKVGYAILSDGDVMRRWTTITLDLLFPYNIVAICLLLFDRTCFSKSWRRFGLLIFFTLTVGGGYRIQLLIVGALVAYYLVSHLSGGKRLVAVGGLACLAVGAGFFLSSRQGEDLIYRFDDQRSSGDSARMREISYALERFLESPIVGNGLVCPIPVEVAFFGREDYLAGVERQQDDYTHVAFLHNIVMYLLMNLGVLGFLGFSLFVLGASRGFVSESKRCPVVTGNSRIACQCALWSILAFNLTAATFTLFQYDLLVGSLVCILAARTRTKSSPARGFVPGRSLGAVSKGTHVPLSPVSAARRSRPRSGVVPRDPPGDSVTTRRQEAIRF